MFDEADALIEEMTEIQQSPTPVVSQVPRKDSDGLYGFDISCYVATLDWKRALAGNHFKFAFIEAARGTTQSGNFKGIWDDADRIIPCGPYQRISSHASGADQASAFVKALESSNGLKSTDLPPVIDIECGDDNAFETIAVYTCIIDEWLSVVESHLKRRALIYTNPLFCEKVGFDSKYGDRALWIANYAVPKPSISKPWEGYHFWQYAQDVNREPFGCTLIDLDFFGGSEQQLNDFIVGSKI